MEASSLEGVVTVVVVHGRDRKKCLRCASAQESYTATEDKIRFWASIVMHGQVELKYSFIQWITLSDCHTYLE